MFWFNHSAQIRALEAKIESLENIVANLQSQIVTNESYIHSDAFHELLASGIFDEEKFDDLAQEAVERCVSNAELKVRF